MVLFASLLAAAATGLLSFWWQQSYWVDLNPPLCSSRLLLQGEKPYSACYTMYGDAPAAPYPLTTLIAFIPFTFLPGLYLGPALIWGSINGLLVFGLLRNQKPWLFLIFLSAPYWIAFSYHQLSPLMAAVMLTPTLLPLVLLKPQLGIPVILRHLNARRLIGLIVFVALTFVIYPGWVGEWYDKTRSFDGVIPMLVFPINLIFLAAFWRFRDPDVRFLFWMACIPQRSLYDLTPLYLLPKSLRQMLTACFFGWGAFVPLLISDYWRIPANQVWLSIGMIYLPILAMLLIDQRHVSQNASKHVDPLE